MIDYETVMQLADHIYHQKREESGRPQHSNYGIESEQVKAVAKALVKEINEALKCFQPSIS